MISASLTPALVLLAGPTRADDGDARAAWAAALPRLSVGALLGRGGEAPGAPHLLLGAYARLSWPLERVRPRARPAGPRPGVAERMAELRRRLAELSHAERTVEAQLDAEETEAEFHALEGDAP